MGWMWLEVMQRASYHVAHVWTVRWVDGLDVVEGGDACPVSCCTVWTERWVDGLPFWDNACVTIILLLLLLLLLLLKTLIFILRKH